LIIASLANLIEILEDLFSVASGSFISLSRLAVLGIRQLLLSIVLSIDINNLGLAALTGTLLLLASALVILALVLKLIVFSLVLIFCLSNVFLLFLGL
jgi:hypothetical protein